MKFNGTLQKVPSIPLKRFKYWHLSIQCYRKFNRYHWPIFIYGTRGTFCTIEFRYRNRNSKLTQTEIYRIFFTLSIRISKVSSVKVYFCTIHDVWSFINTNITTYMYIKVNFSFCKRFFSSHNIHISTISSERKLLKLYPPWIMVDKVSVILSRPFKISWIISKCHSFRLNPSPTDIVSICKQISRCTDLHVHDVHIM